MIQRKEQFAVDPFGLYGIRREDKHEPIAANQVLNFASEIAPGNSVAVNDF